MAEKDELIRFGVSFPAPLLETFDAYIEAQGYTNRSEAIRDMARRSILDASGLQEDEQVAGTIVMVYDHHVSELPLVLMDLQHEHHDAIVSTMHVHLNHDQCLEVIVVRGRLSNLRKLKQRIQVQKGVLYAELSVTYADAAEGRAGHHHVHHRHDGEQA